MSAETVLYRHIVCQKITGVEKTPEVQKTSLFNYPECNGHPPSSPYNWVPADFLGYQIARLLHITDEDLEKKHEISLQHGVECKAKR